MSCTCGVAVPEREKVSNHQLRKHFKRTEGRSVVGCKCKTDGELKVKRLRTRKERNQMRCDGKESSKMKSHCCQHGSSKDTAHFGHCCHSRCYWPSKRDVVPSAQEPSIITDARLIAHHGLFNREVKSIDIERLLTEQRRINDKKEKKTKKTSRRPAESLITDHLFGGNPEEVVPCESKEEPAVENQQRSLSSGRSNTSLEVETINSNKATPVLSNKGRESQLTPTGDRGNATTVKKNLKRLEQTPKGRKAPVHQTPDRGPTSPFQPSCSATDGADDTSHTHKRRKDCNSASKSVSAVAARLCCSLQSPLLRRRNLLAESSKVLLRALRAKHGHRLQENLLEAQRCLGFSPECSGRVQEHRKKQKKQPALVDEDGGWSIDASSEAFRADATRQSGGCTQRTAAIGSKHFNWKSSPHPHQSLEKTPHWLTSPEETSGSLLEDVFRASGSPPFRMDIQPSTPPSRDLLFCHPFVNGPIAAGERSGGFRHGSRSPQPFSYQADRSSVEPRHFPGRNSFENEKYRFAPASFTQISQHQSSNQPVRQPADPPTLPFHSSHHIDVMNFPPSHELETQPSVFSFPSPEHWSFPPMRLY